MNLKHALNEQQRKAVRTLEGPILVLSSAGSGKTRIVTYRIANMIEQGIDSGSILTVTFTNKAADEMKERADKLTDSNIDDIWMGTFHSIGCRILRDNLDRIDYGSSFSIYDQDDSTHLIKQIMSKNNLSKDVIKPKALQSRISSFKRDMKMPEDYYRELKKKDATIDTYEEKVYQCYKEYQKRLKRDYVFDFEDLILKPIKLLRKHDDVREYYQDKFEYLQVDEYQDINNSQYILTKILAKPQNNLLVVGDEDQCQPPGTKVLTTQGYKNIEDLNSSKDKLPSYDKRGSYVVGLSDKYGYDFEKAKRNYSGKMKVIETEDGKISRCTPNHKWITKWADKSTNYNVVYLMRKDNRYRVGHCQLFNSEGCFHLGIRSRLEKADDAWILKVFDNKADSYQWKNIISVKYSIPQITFQAPHAERGYLTEKVINGVYNIVGTEFLKDNALNCLKDFGLKHEYPIWTQKNENERRSGKSIRKMQACNLIPDLMKIPVHIEGKKTKWVKIKDVSNEIYDGPVYSLNVDKHHKYISNKMITCNSIYRFRGAELQNILNFQDEYEKAITIRLEKNYRSTQNIVEASNKVIANNDERLGKTAYSNKYQGEPIVIAENRSPQAEGEFVAQIAKKLNSMGYDYEDIAVLYRSHFQSEPVETKLMENNIPYQVVSSFRFFDREEIQNFIGLLQFLNNPNDNMALINLMKVFNNNVGEKLIGRMTDHARENNIKLVDLLPNAKVVDGIGPKRGKKLKEFYDQYLMPSMEMIDRDDLDLPEKIDRIYDDIFNYDDLLEKYENPRNRRENLHQLMNYINLQHESGKELVDILQNIALINEQEDPSAEDKNKVSLMTMHASKGTEFDVVILIGLEEDIMPHSKSMDTIEQIEEERRLFYVAMTRAKERLFISHCYSRLKFGQRIKPTKSRFLREIPEQHAQKVANF